MKSFVFALCFAVVAVLANPVQERYNKVHQECQKTPGVFVPEIIFEQLKKGQNPALPANFGLHANCMLKKLNFQDEQGHVLSQTVREAARRHYTDSAKVDQIVTACSANKDTKEKTALSVFKCLGDNRIDIGQF